MKEHKTGKCMKNASSKSRAGVHTVTFRATAVTLSIPFFSLLAAFGACKTRKPTPDSSQASKLISEVNWQQRYTEKFAEHEKAMQEHPVGWDWFLNRPLGSFGVPFIVLRLMPEIDPESFGPESAPFQKFGFYQEPTNPGRPLPRGLGWNALEVAAVYTDIGRIPVTTPIDIASVTCAACHTARVRKDDDSLLVVDGAPANSVDVAGFSEAMYKQSQTFFQDEEIAAKKLVALMDAKPKGWFYNDKSVAGVAKEEVQRGIVKILARPLIKLLKTQLVDQLAKQQAYAKAVYNTPESPKLNAPFFAGNGGMSDAMGSVVYMFLPEALFPKTPPIVDPMSVWAQKKRKVGQWNGDLGSHLHRTLLASLLIVGDAKKLDLNKNYDVNEFIGEWAPPPYPFEIDYSAASRGKILYETYCEKCHTKDYDNSKIWPEVKTQESRLRVFNEKSAELVKQDLRTACPPHSVLLRKFKPIQPCKLPENETFRTQTKEGEYGYIAANHEGLWAKAPYLHNGSVPTLYHLLVPSMRPKKFVRGSLSYDKVKIGFQWDVQKFEELKALDKAAYIYNTELEVFSNQGHDENLGIDWGADENKVKLHDLLEFLKTK